ncbi:fimbrial major subunit CsuA/B family protein [Diaphorobacter sp. HDW4B]|uniref:spore coat protein U domain-containing protein n=1 Tax=Diaphorobacter sp. HDW4B TaxID=2714925 RepID=UPI000DB3FB1F|nr:spore coat protein U domain-containing protein [Diaphorobacter sp. HDW4B]PZR01476.1 MAG: hypothetical protein DI539_28425 [Flavobacterium psychrophilum]QIL69970.1 fimbrial major subunit CsuA/B family protein [Diaphorobacter sp. HDW4B]
MKKGKILVALMIALGSSAAMAASANSTTANFQVSATVSPACVIEATNISFGAVTPAPSGKVNATGAISSTCTKTTAYTLEITFDGEAYDGKMFHPDAIASGDLSEKETSLDFQVGLSQIGDRQKDLTGTGKVEVTTVVAELPLNQFVKPGNYSANMHVFLTY